MALDLTNVIPIYKERIDSLIDQMGRNHTLYFKDTIVTEPSEDEVDKIFGGSRRPDYKQNSQIEVTKNTKIIKALIQWNPKDFELKEMRAEFPEGFIRLKTYISYIPDMLAADYVVADSDSVAITGELRYKLIRDIIPRGLGKDLYCVSYWHRIKS
jgi:hypothetical protein